MSQPASPSITAASDQAADHGIPAAFAGLGLPDVLLRALPRLGYREPTAIQSAAIPALLEGRDVTGVAQTGTGKTAAFGLPLLAAIDPELGAVQALVLVPTRELAVQATDAITGFSHLMRRVDVTAIYGGASIGHQISALRHGSQVVVGTPGRVIDLIERGALDLSQVRFVVLDEADEMLRMGFVDDVDRIVGATPSQRQTALFSATMPSAIRRVAAAHLTDPLDVSVAASATPVPRIDQGYAVLRFRDKTAALRRIIAAADADATVVFVRTRSACDEVGTELIGAGVKAAVISGDVTQSERERTIERLRHGTIDVLVATDVAARGMDVERIGLVVNFDAPADPETYIHRVGRTGRAGRSGRALTFFTPKETGRRRAIERVIGQKLDEVPIPTLADVHQVRASGTIAGALARLGAGRLAQYSSMVRDAAERTETSIEEIAAALIAAAIGDDGAPDTQQFTTYQPRDKRRREDGAGGRDRRRSDRRPEYGGRRGDAAGRRFDSSRRRDDRRGWSNDAAASGRRAGSGARRGGRDGGAAGRSWEPADRGGRGRRPARSDWGTGRRSSGSRRSNSAA